MMIFPASTCSPPKRLTPSRLACDSRPFLVLPPAVFCAMTDCLRHSARADVGDFDVGELLPVVLLPQIVLAAAELHDRHLRTLPVAHDGRDDLPALEQRLAEL